MVVNMECFVIYANDIKGRLDPLYYTSQFVELNKILNKGKYKLVKLGSLLKELYRYPTFYNIEFKKTGIICIKTTNITKEGILKPFNSEEYDFIDFAVNSRFPRTILEENDLVMTVRGATIGKIAIITNDFSGANINPNLIRISLKKEEINPYYFWIYFNSNIGKKLFIKQVANTAKQTITVPQIKDLLIPLPPISIQNRIIQFMDSIYSKKKLKEFEARRLLDSLDDYVLDTLGIKIPELKDRMAFVVNSNEIQNNRIGAYYYQPKFEEIEKAITKGYFEVQELNKFITRIYYGASVKNQYIEKGIPFLRIQNLKPRRIDLSNVVKLPETMKKELGNAFVREGDFLISRSGTVGVVSVVPKEADGYAFGSFMIKFCLNNKINADYISIWLNSKVAKMFTEREKIGAIQGNITIETIKNFKIPLPPIDIQNKIAEEVKSRMHKAEQLQKEAKEELEEAKLEVERMILGEKG